MTFQGKFQEDFINYCEGTSDEDPTQEICDMVGEGASDKVCPNVEEIRDEMCNELAVTRSKFRKDRFMDYIKQKSNAFSKSVELLDKIKNTNNKKYIEEYKDLYCRHRDRRERDCLDGLLSF